MELLNIELNKEIESRAKDIARHKVDSNAFYVSHVINRNSKKRKRRQSNRKYQRVPRQYNAYIKSPWWEKRKNRYWRQYKKVCYRCDSCEHVQLHHIKYGWTEFGREPDEWLIPMCEQCHKFFHSKYGVKADMTNEMKLFDEEYPFIHRKQ